MGIGITRKIDELGRIVVPKEIRKKLNIKIGEPLELSIIDKETFVVKKYSSMSHIVYYAEELALSIYNNTNKTCLITDTNKVIAVGSLNNRNFLNKELSKKSYDIISLRNIYESKNSGKINIFKDESINFESQIIIPIIAASDIVGSIILLGEGNNSTINSADIAIIKTITQFLSMKIEL